MLLNRLTNSHFGHLLERENTENIILQSVIGRYYTDNI